MNRKSYIDLFLKYKPILNPYEKTPTLFFYDYRPDTKERKFLESVNPKQIWTWTLPNVDKCCDMFNSGWWNFDRNCYMVTEIPVEEENFRKIFLEVLPRDWNKLDLHESKLKLMEVS